MLTKLLRVFDEPQLLKNNDRPYIKFKVLYPARGEYKGIKVYSDKITCLIYDDTPKLIQYVLDSNIKPNDFVEVTGELTITFYKDIKYLSLIVKNLAVYTKAEIGQRLDIKATTSSIVQAVNEPIEVRFNNSGVVEDEDYFKRKE